EPHAGAASHAIAAMLDRGRYGILPQSCVQDALAQQAAILAANLAAKPDNWRKYYAELQVSEGDISELVITAIALGWSDKWRACWGHILSPLPLRYPSTWRSETPSTVGIRFVSLDRACARSKTSFVRAVLTATPGALRCF